MSHSESGLTINTHFVIKPDAPSPFFEPVEGSHLDRFGNRLHLSPQFAYKNREDVLIRAALLVSPIGRKLISVHRGILRRIEDALTEDPEGTAPSRSLADGVTLSPMEDLGFNSIPRRLDVDGKSYVIKTPRPIPPDQRKVNQQPYIAEMLQIAALSRDLENDFQRYGIDLCIPIFASGQVSCAEFIDGDLPRDSFFETHCVWLYKKLTEYINGQVSSGNLLWKNVNVDTSNGNFKRTGDGRHTWFDPLFYDPFLDGKAIRWTPDVTQLNTKTQEFP